MSDHSSPSRPAFPDLSVHPPRSPRCTLGGYALLPRLIDKCRADLAGTIGDYHTDCPIDQVFLEFVGVDYQALREQIADGKSDGELLKWIEEHASNPRAPWEIEQWSDYQNRRGPAPQTPQFDFFLSLLAEIGPGRTDIRTWADLLDLDDYCSFGGKP